MTKSLQVREHTRDVHFWQCSLNQVFFWQGHCYRKLTGNRGEKRTDDFGQQVQGPGLEVLFSDDEVVVISNDDAGSLRTFSM